MDTSCIKDNEHVLKKGKELEAKPKLMPSATELPSAAETKASTATRVACEISAKDKGSYLANRVNRLPKATIVNG